MSDDLDLTKLFVADYQKLAQELKELRKAGGGKDCEPCRQALQKALEDLQQASAERDECSQQLGQARDDVRRFQLEAGKPKDKSGESSPQLEQAQGEVRRLKEELRASNKRVEALETAQKKDPSTSTPTDAIKRLNEHIALLEFQMSELREENHRLR